jgi:protein-L-isoaspartate(D-aspartate) O-methyltransferase
VGGRLVLPVGPGGDQELVRLRRVAEDEFERDRLGAVRFVPLVSDEA